MLSDDTEAASMLRVLVVDGHTELASRLAALLGPFGLSVQGLASCAEADTYLTDHDVSVLLLGSLLPDRSGVQYLKLLRSYPSTRNLPLIMLGSSATDIDVALSLDAGADDFVHKPVSAHELQRRILAVMRRCMHRVATPVPPPTLRRCGPLTLDESHRRAFVHDEPLPLRPTEVDLLSCLMAARGRVFTRAQLVKRVCGSEDVRERVIDVHVRRLRAALSAHSIEDMIDTVRGVGYRLTNLPGQGGDSR